MKANSISVVYLARLPEGIESFRQFVDSYRLFCPGIEHSLLVIFKGCELGSDALTSAQGEFSSVQHESILLSDEGVDIGAYLKAAHNSDSKYICFINTHTTILSKNWLLNLFNAISSPNVGLAGATGSFESFSTSSRLVAKANWLINHRRVSSNSLLESHFSFLVEPFQKDGLSSWMGAPIIGRKFSSFVRLLKGHGLTKAIEDEWNRVWEAATSPDGPYYYMDKIPEFPNPHIRSNGFIVDREWLIDRFPSIEPTKEAAYQFESGFSGLSRTVLDEGKELVIVDKDGRTYLPEEWHYSAVYRSFCQEGLILSDNQTRHFANMKGKDRILYNFMTWGINSQNIEVYKKLSPYLDLEVFKAHISGPKAAL